MTPPPSAAQEEGEGEGWLTQSASAWKSELKGPSPVQLMIIINSEQALHSSQLAWENARISDSEVLKTRPMAAMPGVVGVGGRWTG